MQKLTDNEMTSEAAEILDVSKNTLRACAKEGNIPVRRNPANGNRLFRSRDLEKFIKKLDRPQR